MSRAASRPRAHPRVTGDRTGMIDVSARFDSTAAVNGALVALSAAGLPRDLIEVVVAPAAAQRFYGGTVHGPGRETLRFAGIGGLVGLGAAIALGMLALGGDATPGAAALVQLLGPNLATVTGAVVGGAIGMFVRRGPAPRHRPAGEAPDAILVLVRARSDAEARAIAPMLASAGGRDLAPGTAPPITPIPSLHALPPEPHAT